MADYKIEVPHFYQMSYIEGDRVMKVEIDMRDPVPVIYKKAIVRWSAPHEEEILSDEKKEEIIARIYDYLTRVKPYREVEIERGP